MVNTIQMTQTGYDELAKELEELKTTKRSEIAEKIKIARGYGDLSENSEYDAAKNEQAERAEQDGKPVYGTRRFSAPAYLQYELTRFKLDFAEPCEKIRALGICPDFTDAQTRAWYDANPDLFTRYAGDSFPYEEVKQIIEKRMREEVYDSLVQDLLRGPADRP